MWWQDGDTDLSPEDCMNSLEEDWEVDAKDSGQMSFDAFSRSWFELADVYVDSVSPQISPEIT